ncbi:cytochrome P450 [Byssothecium circinans]|uniref:Cytochrome P450 n=1 Tax=Byssothecium circinans TaxID=147558 RepID=A0A6A5T8H5_9PLEO|nr:cytochrome P450 [Byssothecium circinans]
MFFQVLYDVEAHSKYASILFRLLLPTCVSYIGWRLWRFTVVPRMQKYDPPVLPYWIPFLGNTIPFVKDANGLLTQARQHFGQRREPFSIVLGGQTIYVLTSATDVTDAYRKTRELTFDGYVKAMLTTFIQDEEAISRMWASPPKFIRETKGPRYPNPNDLCIAHLGESILVQQLNAGPQSKKTEDICIRKIEAKMAWNLIPESLTRTSDAKTKVLSLKQLCQSVLLQCASRAIFGDVLMDTNPNLVNDFLKFDESSWQLNYRVPAFLCPDMHSGLESIRRAMTKYIALPPEQKQDASWMLPIITDEMKAIGFSPRHTGSFFSSVFWLSNSNSWKLAFWMISYIVYSPSLHSRVKAEVRAHIRASTSITDQFANLQNCNWLMATYQETLRMTVSSTSVRRVEGDCVVGKRLFRKNGQLIIPYRQMLMDEEVFGHDAATFNPRRFVENPSLSRHPSYRPFGGGVTYCPGRSLALKEMLAIVSLFVGNFDVRLLEPGGDFPKQDETKPCLGVLAPMRNVDVMLKVKEI